MALLSLFSFAVNAQETDITGLWKGTLYNDTTQMNYQYEIGISKEKGKYVGFSHTWFVLDDKQYYGVKKVSIRIANDGKIIVEDDGLISNNYPVPPNKNVRQLNVLTLDAASPIMTLTGPFSTNRTKEYHVLTGSVSLQRKNDFWQSALIPHLEELGKANDLSFVRMQKEAANKLRSDANATAAKNNINKQAEEKQSAEATLKKETAAKEKAAKKEEQVQLKLAAEIAKVELEAQEAAEKAANAAEIAKEKERKKEEAALAKQAEVLAKAEAAAKDAAQKATAKQAVAQQKEAAEKIKLTREIEKKEAAQAKKEAAEKAALAKKAAAAAEEKSAKATAAIAKQVAAEKAQATEQAAAEKANKTTENSKTAIASTQKVDNRKEAPVLVSKPAASVNERQTIVQQTVSFSSDSLLLTLYDNGEVDGDTVSVLLNGQLILEKQGLSTVAIKKTIYIPANTDRMELVMYAESLGSIPPNTGLLVIRDGKQLYEVRFSGDLQKNAAIVFNRKKE
jgi:archaellum component FlaF (FlaF/FlaG flagellin family)